MVATLQDRPSAVEEPTGDDVPVLEDDLLARIEVLPEWDDHGAERRRSAERLLAITGGRREPLEQLRSRFWERLHRASDDFDATEGLRVTETALALIPWPEGPWAWRAQERTRTRWRRRRGP